MDYPFLKTGHFGVPKLCLGQRDRLPKNGTIPFGTGRMVMVTLVMPINSASVKKSRMECMDFFMHKSQNALQQTVHYVIQNDRYTYRQDYVTSCVMKSLPVEKYKRQALKPRRVSWNLTCKQADMHETIGGLTKTDELACEVTDNSLTLEHKMDVLVENLKIMEEYIEVSTEIEEILEECYIERGRHGGS
ncbi:hypothetical protein AVEN_157389-1 [Araneus ventricosus]|uniref:Uncharacterized protein n=1 Tax=Araneus ventricosus TaxID=182803 RepID=A0A4Y2QWI8_ARAVE|nr:hypothetical protein AVEN_157389-1 [Araneus ventricosus]